MNSLMRVPYDRLVLGVFDDGTTWPIKWIEPSVRRFKSGFRTMPERADDGAKLIAWMGLPSFNTIEIRHYRASQAIAS